MLRSLRPALAPPKAPSKNPSAKKTNTATAPPGPRLPDPASWDQGLSQPKKYEWLVDCYRMRVDDDYAMGGGNLRGLYNQPADKVSHSGEWVDRRIGGDTHGRIGYTCTDRAALAPGSLMALTGLHVLVVSMLKATYDGGVIIMA